MKLLPVLIIGLVLGLAGGLVFTWGIAPVEYVNTFPPYMNSAYRKDWIHMAALAYGLEGNLERTRLRLQGLPAEEIHFVLLETLDDAVSKNIDIDSIKPLAKLAANYGIDSPAVRVYTEQEIISPEMLMATPTPIPTIKPPTPTPTLTPLPTPTLFSTDTATSVAPAFTVISHTLSCSEVPTIAVSLELTSTLGTEYAEDISRTLGISPTLLLTQTTDITTTLDLTGTLDITATVDITSTLNLSRTLELTNTQEVAGEEPTFHTQNWGREIWLMWDEGADRAFTGFRPEFGLGYADFIVEPGRTYNLYIDYPWGVPLMVLQVEPCTPAEGGGWVSRKLIVVEGLER